MKKIKLSISIIAPFVGTTATHFFIKFLCLNVGVVPDFGLIVFDIVVFIVICVALMFNEK